MEQYNQITAASPLVAAYFGSSPSYGGAPPVIDTSRRGTASLLNAGIQRNRVFGHSISAALDISDQLTLKSITAWRRASSPDIPFAIGPAGLLGPTTTSQGVAVPVRIFSTSRYQFTRQFSQELQALGDVGDLHYTFGFFYYRENGKFDNRSTTNFVISPTLSAVFPASGPVQSRTRSTAGYGEISYQPGFAEGLELTGGLRYTHDRRKVVLTSRTGDATFNNITWSASAKYSWTPDVMTFARVGTGIRAGGFNTRATATQAFEFAPEKATSYEIGLKSQLFEDRVRLNAGLFYTKYDDLQVTTFVISSGGGSGGGTVNASATYKGGELELTVTPSNELSMMLNAAYVDPKYKRIFFVDPATDVLRNYADEAKFPYTAKFSLNAAVNYVIARTDWAMVSVSVNYQNLSKRYFFISSLPTQNPSNEQIASNGMNQVNARLDVAEIPAGPGTLNIGLWADNLTNSFYRVAGVDFGLLGIATNTYNPPRTFGIDVRFELRQAGKRGERHSR